MATSAQAAALEARDPLPHGIDPLPRDPAGELEEQFVLRLEVRVERAAREAGALADRLDGCRVQPSSANTWAAASSSFWRVASRRREVDAFAG